MYRWQRRVLLKQGFLNQPLKQFELGEQLGDGSTLAKVVKAQHVYNE